MTEDRDSIETGIGEALRETFERCGLTQKTIGQLLKVSQATVSDWVRGRTTPSIETLMQIEAEVGAPATVEQVLRLAGVIKAKTTEQVIAFDSRLDEDGEQEVLTAYRHAVAATSVRHRQRQVKADLDRTTDELDEAQRRLKVLSVKTPSSVRVDVALREVQDAQGRLLTLKAQAGELQAKLAELADAGPATTQPDIIPLMPAIPQRVVRWETPQQQANFEEAVGSILARYQEPLAEATATAVATAMTESMKPLVESMHEMVSRVAAAWAAGSGDPDEADPAGIEAVEPPHRRADRDPVEC